MFQVTEGFASSQTDVIANKIRFQLQQSWSSLHDICLNKQISSRHTSISLNIRFMNICLLYAAVFLNKIDSKI